MFCDPVSKATVYSSKFSVPLQALRRIPQMSSDLPEELSPISFKFYFSRNWITTEAIQKDMHAQNVSHSNLPSPIVLGKLLIFQRKPQNAISKYPLLTGSQ